MTRPTPDLIEPTPAALAAARQNANGGDLAGQTATPTQKPRYYALIGVHTMSYAKLAIYGVGAWWSGSPTSTLGADFLRLNGGFPPLRLVVGLCPMRNGQSGQRLTGQRRTSLCWPHEQSRHLARMILSGLMNMIGLLPRKAEPSSDLPGVC